MLVALAGGIGAYSALGIEPADGVFLLALLLCAGAGVAARRGILLPVSLMLSVFLGGFVLAKARTEAVRAPAIERRMGPVTLTGIVEDADPARGRQMRVVARVISIDGLAAEALPRRLVLIMPGAAGLKPGVGIRVNVTLAPSLTPVLPGGYDGARAQWFAGIGGTGFARKAPVVGPPAADSGIWLLLHASVAELRAAMNARIRAVLDGDVGAFAMAIITGERSNLSSAAMDHMQVSGLAHIVSISGLHMTLVAGSVFWCVRALLALSAELALTRPIKKYAAMAGILAGLFYTILSGAQVAALIAFLMIAVMFAAVLVDRSAISMRNLAIAAVLIILLMPEAVMSASFQMSFLAVTGLVAMHEIVSQWRRVPDEARPLWRKALWLVAAYVAVAAATSIVAGLFSGIAAAYHFNRLSPYSLIANLLAAPIVTFLVMPAALLSALLMPLGLEDWSLRLLGLGLVKVLAISVWTAGLPGAAGLVPQITALGAVLMATGALWLCLWRQQLRVAGLVILFAGFGLMGTAPAPDLLIERTARNVAVRLADGTLAFADGRRGRHAAEKWLSAAADGESLGAAAKRAAWNCAPGDCETRLGGRRVIFLRGLENADRLPCVAGDIVVADFPLRRNCRNAELRIDRFSVWRDGAHAVFVGRDGSLVVQTAQGERGHRPWVTEIKRRLKPHDTTSAPPQ